MSFIFEKKALAKLTLEARLKDSEETLVGISFKITNEQGKELSEADLKEGIELGKYSITVVFDETKYKLVEGKQAREVVFEKEMKRL